MKRGEVRKLLDAEPGGLTASQLSKQLSVPLQEVELALERASLSRKAERLGPVWVPQGRLEEAAAAIESAMIELHAHSPKRKGFAKAAVLKRAGLDGAAIGEPILARLVDERRLRQVGDLLAQTDYKPELSERRALFLEVIVGMLEEGGETPPSPHRISLAINAPLAAVLVALKAAESRKLVKKLAEDVYYDAGRLKQLVERFRKMQETKPFGPREVREKLGLSRKYSDALTTYLESSGSAERRGSTLSLKPSAD